MKKCVYIFTLFIATVLFISCVGEGNKKETAEKTVSTHTSVDSGFIISDTTVQIAIDTLNDDSPVLTIASSLELAVATLEHAKEINNTITYAAYGNDTTPASIATDMFIKEISNEYSSLRADYINVREVNDTPTWLNHSYNIKGRISDIHNNIINYIIESDVYTGGAHGLFTITLLNIDRTNGYELKLSDIFVENYEERLTNALTNALMMQLGAKDINEVKELGYVTMNDMYSTENFLLKKDSIVFVYNRYDIAPYSHGITRLAIDRNDIKELLKPNQCP